MFTPSFWASWTGTRPNHLTLADGCRVFTGLHATFMAQLTLVQCSTLSVSAPSIWYWLLRCPVPLAGSHLLHPFPSPLSHLDLLFSSGPTHPPGCSRMRRICISKLVFLLLCIWTRVSPAKIHGNPANDLVALINGKRTASKLPALRNSKGLGCMALQYISECMAAGAAACSSGNTVACKPPEAHITEVYAANCGVELPTVDVISGRLVACHRERDSPEDALQALLESSLSVIRGKEHTQVGAGFDRAHRRGPFFWCLLFSSGSANSTFLLEAGGKGIDQTHGCFSAPDRPSCNAAAAPATRPSQQLIAGAAAALLFRLLFF